jgi:hypothetical protein
VKRLPRPHGISTGSDAQIRVSPGTETMPMMITWSSLSVGESLAANGGPQQSTCSQPEAEQCTGAGEQGKNVGKNGACDPCSTPYAVRGVGGSSSSRHGWDGTRRLEKELWFVGNLGNLKSNLIQKIKSTKITEGIIPSGIHTGASRHSTCRCSRPARCSAERKQCRCSLPPVAQRSDHEQ